MVRYNDLTNSSVNYEADVRRRIVNVDADFRESTSVAAGCNRGSTASDFLFRLTTPVRNVEGYKVIGVELNGITFGANYALLQINDESSIESKGGSASAAPPTLGTELRAVAKIPRPVTSVSGLQLLTESTGLIAEHVAFRNPQDVAVLRTRLVNPDGTVLNASGGKFSFTLELNEITNSYLYESRRKHIGYDPANALK